MLFHGVQIERKFGFNGPVGIFVDEQTTKIIKKSTNENSYEAFYDYAKDQQDVVDLLAWYHGRESLTDEDIMKSWDTENDGCIKDILSGHCMQIAKLRALKEAMAFRKAADSDSIPDDMVHSIYDLMSSYQWWKDTNEKK